MSSRGDADVDLAHAMWRKPRRSQGNGACVEVADGIPGVVPVRDSKDPSSALVLPADAWQAFVGHVKS
jgi:hypothetical protein